MNHIQVSVGILDGANDIPYEVELPLPLRFRATQKDRTVHAECCTYCPRKRG